MNTMTMENTEVERIDRLEAYLKILETKGRIFSVGIVKKDGTFRNLVCRLGVTKGVKGTGLRFAPLAKRLMTVYDIQKHAFRTVNLQTMFKVTVAGKSYTII